MEGTIILFEYRRPKLKLQSLISLHLLLNISGSRRGIGPHIFSLDLTEIDLFEWTNKKKKKKKFVRVFKLAVCWSI